MDQTLYTLWFVTGAIRFGRAKTMNERMRFAARTPTPTRVPEYDARHGRAQKRRQHDHSRAHREDLSIHRPCDVEAHEYKAPDAYLKAARDASSLLANANILASSLSRNTASLTSAAAVSPTRVFTACAQARHVHASPAPHARATAHENTAYDPRASAPNHRESHRHHSS